MKKSVSVLLFALLVLTSTAAFAANDQAADSAPACVATLAPESAAHGAAVAVVATLSAPIGKVTEVRIAADSKATISDVMWDAADPTRVQFKADLSAAAAGAWSVDFVGADGSCHGTLKVAE